jgi:hypothetical protein
VTWLNSDLFLFDGEVIGVADQFDPVADGVLGWVRQLDVLGDEVTENSWEFDLGLGHVVGQ